VEEMMAPISLIVQLQEKEMITTNTTPLNSFTDGLIPSM
jgi:hypothetical protein